MMAEVRKNETFNTSVSYALAKLFLLFAHILLKLKLNLSRSALG